MNKSNPDMDLRNMLENKRINYADDTKDKAHDIAKARDMHSDMKALKCLKRNGKLTENKNYYIGLTIPSCAPCYISMAVSNDLNKGKVQSIGTDYRIFPGWHSGIENNEQEQKRFNAELKKTIVYQVYDKSKFEKVRKKLSQTNKNLIDAKDALTKLNNKSNSTSVRPKYQRKANQTIQTNENTIKTLREEKTKLKKELDELEKEFLLTQKLTRNAINESNTTYTSRVKYPASNPSATGGDDGWGMYNPNSPSSHLSKSQKRKQRQKKLEGSKPSPLIATTTLESSQNTLSSVSSDNSLEYENWEDMVSGSDEENNKASTTADLCPHDYKTTTTTQAERYAKDKALQNEIYNESQGQQKIPTSQTSESPEPSSISPSLEQEVQNIVSTRV